MPGAPFGERGTGNLGYHTAYSITKYENCDKLLTHGEPDIVGKLISQSINLRARDDGSGNMDAI
jgi:hypothetical protein